MKHFTLTPDHKTSPSAAHRWVPCQASVGYCVDVVDWEEEERPNTVRGGEEHILAADLLTGKRKRTSNKHVRSYVNFVRALPNVDLGTELEFPVPYRPDRQCFVDSLKLDTNESLLHVTDLKTGIKFVEAYENPQGLIYAWAASRTLSDWIPWNKVAIHIFAPRQPEAKQVQTWKITRDEMQDCIKPIQSAYDAISTTHWTDLPFAPSENACRFCPAKTVCAARAEHLTETFQLEQKVQKAIDVNTVSDEVLGKVVREKKRMIKVLEDLSKEAYRRAQLRKDEFLNTSGLKMVLGRPGNRTWASGQSPADVLGESAYKDPVVMSPNQLEEADPKGYAKVSDMVHRSPGKPVLVSEDDKRPAIVESGGFTDEPEPEK